jgi:hypothetical protein
LVFFNVCTNSLKNLLSITKTGVKCFCNGIIIYKNIEIYKGGFLKDTTESTKSKNHFFPGSPWG